MSLENGLSKGGVEFAVPTGQAARLSIEVGHLYLDGIVTSSHARKKMRKFFRPIARQIATILKSRGITDNFSTCFLVDDYGKLQDPDAIPQKVLGDIVIPAAKDVGLQIDYIVREGGCARLADTYMPTLTGVSEDDPRFPDLVVLSGTEEIPNRRSEQSQPIGSMKMDIELANTEGGITIYSCPFLASIFQNLRLGLLHDPRNPDTLAQLVDSNQLGDDWEKLPVIMKLHEEAPPFEAFESFSIINDRFRDVETAVRFITNNIVLDQIPGEARMQALARAQGYKLNHSPSNRRGYIPPM
jgi:hypothetical protein